MCGKRQIALRADFPRFVSLIVHICLRLIGGTYIFIPTRKVPRFLLSFPPSLHSELVTQCWAALFCPEWREKSHFYWYTHFLCIGGTYKGGVCLCTPPSSQRLMVTGGWLAASSGCSLFLRLMSAGIGFRNIQYIHVFFPAVGVHFSAKTGTCRGTCPGYRLAFTGANSAEHASCLRLGDQPTLPNLRSQRAWPDWDTTPQPPRRQRPVWRQGRWYQGGFLAVT